MKRIFAFVVVLLFAVAVTAQNPHINKQDQADVVAYVDGVTVYFTGLVAGCGRASTVDAYLIVDALVKTECYNPAGQGPVPGQSGITFTGEVETFAVAKNGKALISCSATIDDTVEGPNSQWNCFVAGIISINSVTLVINGIEMDVTSYFQY